MRRRLCLVFCVLLFSSALVVQGAPPHVNFDEADEDLFAIVAFLSDVKLLAEGCLASSLAANCSMSFNESVVMNYSVFDLDESLEYSGDLQEMLSYSSTVLDEIEEGVGSYQYLKDVLVPLKALGWNVSSFVKDHEQILLNFTTLVDFVNHGGNETAALFALADVRSAIVDARAHLTGVELNTDGIGESFSTATLTDLISRLRSLLDRYESYTEVLLGYHASVEPLLLLYVDDPSVYLGEEIEVYGYFMAWGEFVLDQDVQLFWDDTIIQQFSTDDRGRYEGDIPILLDETPGGYTLTSSTTYDGTVYGSNEVLVRIDRIPTYLAFSTDKTHYYLDESVVFSGRLVDYKNQGIQSELSLHGADTVISLSTDEHGWFTYEYPITLGFGRYEIFVSYDPDKIYQPSISEKIAISVDTPTSLSLVADKKRFVIGDTVSLSGFLRSSVDASPLSEKLIAVFLNNQLMGIAVTETDGFYQFTLSTSNRKAGTYRIFTRFSSDDVVWRGSSSTSVSIVLVPGIVQTLTDHSLLLTVVFVFLVFAFLLFILRKHLLAIVRSRGRVGLAVSTSSDKTVPYRMRRPLFGRFTKKAHDFEVSDTTIDNCNEAIITRYRSLVSLLTRLGVMLHPTDTHLDVHRTMIGRGVPHDLSEQVTFMFELARYSPYQANRHDVTVFDEQVLRILREVGAMRG